jgi:hypothetical protein
MSEVEKEANEQSRKTNKQREMMMFLWVLSPSRLIDRY